MKENIKYELPEGFVWIKDFYCRYAINRKGDVYSSISNRLLRSNIKKSSAHKGMRFISLGQNPREGFCIAYLVAENFMSKPVSFNNTSYFISYIDSDKGNCNVTNLEYKPFNTDDSGNRVRRIRFLYTGETFCSIADCARKLNFCLRTIYYNLSGKAKKIKFEYIDV